MAEKFSPTLAAERLALLRLICLWGGASRPPRLPSNFSSEPAVLALGLLEGESTVAHRRAYVYNPRSQEPNILFESAQAQPGVSAESLGSQTQDPRAALLTDLGAPQPIVMRGSLYSYRRSQSRALLRYHHFRGYRRRHLRLLVRSLVSKGAHYESGGGQTLLSALTQVFFFLSPGLVRRVLKSGGAFVNFRRVDKPLLKLRPGDFISLTPAPEDPERACLACLAHLVDSGRARMAESALSSLPRPRPRSESRALSGALSASPLSQGVEADYLSFSFFFLPDYSRERVWLPFNPTLVRLLDIK